MIIEKFFIRDKNGNITDNIKSTKNIINIIEEESIMASKSFGNSPIFKLAQTLIEIKAIRAETNAIKEQTKAINKNSKSSDRLTIIGIILSVVIFVTEITPIKNFIINLF